MNTKVDAKKKAETKIRNIVYVQITHPPTKGRNHVKGKRKNQLIHSTTRLHKYTITNTPSHAYNTTTPHHIQNLYKANNKPLFCTYVPKLFKGIERKQQLNLSSLFAYV